MKVLTVNLLCLTIVSLCCCNLVYAQHPSVSIRVTSPEGKALAGIELGIRGSDLTSPPTNKKGITKVRLPSQIHAGDIVCLQVMGARKDLILISPLNGCLVLPFTGHSQNPVSIIAVNRGKQSILEEELKSGKDQLIRDALSLARRFYEQGNYQQSVNSYREALVLRPDDAEILNGLGLALTKISNYEQAEAVYQRSLAIREQTLGEKHPDVARTLNDLGELLYTEGRYDQAQVLFERALIITENKPGIGDISATSLNSLGAVYAKKGDYKRAIDLYQRALEIRNSQENPDLAYTLNNLGNVYRSMGQFDQAKVVYERALAIFNKTLGATHPEVALLLDNLAVLYFDRGDYVQAELLLKRALEIKERAGADNIDVAYSLNNLAVLYIKRNDYALAEGYLRRSLAIREKALGSKDPNVAYSIGNLGDLYYLKGDYSKAEPLYQRALSILEESLGQEHPASATFMKRLGRLYVAKGDYAHAELLYKRALKVEEKTLGPDQVVIASTLDDYADLLSKMNRVEEAQILRARVKLIRGKMSRDDIAKPFKPFLLDSQYYPSGWMGDIVGEDGKVIITTEAATIEGRPAVATKIDYKKGNKGWAGIYWQHPDGNWGDRVGFSLVGAKKISFYAKGERGGEVVEFISGGISGEGKSYQDGFRKSTGAVVLNATWTKYIIDLSDLKDAQLSSVIGAFGWVGSGGFDKDGHLVTYIADLKVE
jgi:tetratricopeptide (TPR) repeat protein